MKKILCLILVIFLVSGCGRNPQKYETNFFAFDTYVNITLYEKNDALLKECEELAKKYENMFSKTREGSDIYILNQTGEHKVSPETYYLIEKGLYYNKMTEGLFDITVGALSEIWKSSVPSDEEIQNAKNTVGADKVTLYDGKVTLKKGTKIDLGGIAKGYIADKMAELFKNHNQSGIINLGGNVYAVGTKTGEKFKVGIQKPKTEGESIYVLEVSDTSVVTSGIYERYFEEDGKEYHHIIDPKTGRPLDNNLYSATVISSSSMEADIFSTALLLMGDKALSFAEKNNIQAVLIDKNYTVALTKKLK